MNESKIKILDAALVKAAKKIKVLNALRWPADEEEKFLSHWRAGKTRLPQISFEIPDVSVNVNQLNLIAKQCDTSNPVEKFIAETAGSYSDAGKMLLSIGTPEFTRYSTRIYGRPDMVYKYQKITAVDAARFFLETTDKLWAISIFSLPKQIFRHRNLPAG